MKLVDVTNQQGETIDLGSLKRAEAVHRQLRPQLPADYVATMQAVFVNGARMLLAMSEDGQVRGVAVWRLVHNTFEGLRLYVDDLVTDEQMRSTGIGKALLAHLENYAKAQGCDVLALDSGTQRAEAHKFYFREGMHISAYSFRKSLK